MSRNIASHYRRLLIKHGDSPAAVQYSSLESQERRFAVLAKIGDLSGSRILDFGCGMGHLATFLKRKGVFPAHYTGVDIVDEFLAIGRSKHPDYRFCHFAEISGESFDYVLVSGVFNNRRRDNRKFYQQTLGILFGLCNRGVAFNMMSTYVDYRDPGLFYESPERVLSFTKKELTPYVCLHHDYQVKPGILPFEFAVFAYKAPVPLDA